MKIENAIALLADAAVLLSVKVSVSVLFDDDYNLYDIT